MGRKKTKLVLQVCIGNSIVGRLEKSSAGTVAFQYRDSWLQHPQAMAISTSLPLRSEPHVGQTAHSFFENLLPENRELRRKIAEKVHAPSSEAIDLLSAIGQDCVGALQLLSEDSTPPKEIPEVTGERLNENQIEEILNNLSTTPLGLERDKDFRISIAGEQEKTALLKIRNSWYRPKGAVPTSHIFKRSMGKLPNGIDMSESVQIEWMCLTLCRKFGLEVAHAEIERFGETEALVVKRFDREWSEDRKKLYRTPIEDLCQACGKNSAIKYDSDGGPGIAEIMALLSTSNRREKDQQSFLKAQIVFQLLGATDGHAKNFSLFLGPRGINLTPIYDVLTAYPALAHRQIERKEMKLAMAVGKNRKWRIHEIQRRHWYQTAELIRFNSDQLDLIFEELEAAVDNLTIETKELPPHFPESLLDITIQGIQRTKRQLFS